jgi:hypothetical protein
MPLSSDNWSLLLNQIDAGDNKSVALDLSACTASSSSGTALSSGGLFDPRVHDLPVNRIVSLVLPNTATTIAGDETTGLSQYRLKKVSGASITGLSHNLFRGNTRLTEVDFPKLTSIAPSTFRGCTSLATVNIPSITLIEQFAFGDTGAETDITITMGRTAPSVLSETY